MHHHIQDVKYIYVKYIYDSTKLMYNKHLFCATPEKYPLECVWL